MKRRFTGERIIGPIKASGLCKPKTACFTEEQIIGSIKEHESGVETGDICRRPPSDSVSRGAFHNLAQQRAGLEVNEAKRMRELESENSRLKKLLAEKALENGAMRDILSKTW